MKQQIQFITTVSFAGKLRRAGDILTVSNRDGVQLIERKLAVPLFQATEKVMERPEHLKQREKRIEAIETGSGWYEIRQGSTVLKKIRGVDKANQFIEELNEKNT